jgi:DNA-binding response OmpR family regulator
MKKPLILYVEDELVLAEIVKESLEDKGYEVLHAADATIATALFSASTPQLIILDVMLPDPQGFELAKQFRATNQNIPIIFLTSKSEPASVVQGFESGGSDYLKKPFSIQELLIRIKVLLSDGRVLPVAINESSTLPIGKYLFHPLKAVLTNNDQIIKLTSREAEILKALLHNKNNITSRSSLLKSMWGNDDFFSGRSLDVFITKLRKHLKDDPTIEIVNVRGIGYKIID